MDADRFIRMVVAVQHHVGKVVHRDRAIAIAFQLRDQKPRWTCQEAENAYYLILEDEVILKEINYDKTVTVKPFVMARKRFATRRGRLFTYKQATRTCQHHGETMDEMFEVVCVEGDYESTGVLRAHWKVRDTYIPPATIN